jgi:Fic family protein
VPFSPGKPFDLPPLPPSLDFKHERFIDLLLPTRTVLGELNGYSHALPNPLLLLSPAVIRESVASSNIENINTTLEEALQMQLFPESQRGKADKEVLRYRDAILWGFDQMKKLPISTRLIVGIQKKLLPDRNSNYRTTQNKITNTATGETLYTPPSANEVPRLMSNWEKFINTDDDGVDSLVKSAIAHYQFEAIHPFGDGNGRTGRILMVLYLVQQKLLSLPILYVSGYINDNRSGYYRLLREVSASGNWNEFIIFMLKGFHSQAKATKETLFKVMDLLHATKERVRSKHKQIYTADLVETLFTYPIITPVTLGKRLDMNYRTASKYLSELVKGKVLQDSYVGKYHLFINKPLLSILKN